MFNRIPGTVLFSDIDSLIAPFDKIEALFSSTGGLTLSQVSVACGIEPTTIQNWVKRGWVASPQNKRYSEIQIMRIILINMLRGAMSLDSIAELMTYVNGSVEDRSDDIIPDRDLFCLLCRVIHNANSEKTAEKEDLERMIDYELRDFDSPFPNAEEKLRKALLVMALAYVSVVIKEQALEEYRKMVNL